MYRKFPTYYVGQIALQVGPKNTHKISRKFPTWLIVNQVGNLEEVSRDFRETAPVRRRETYFCNGT